MIKRVWIGAVGAALLGAVVAEASERAIVLDPGALDAVTAGSATSLSTGYASASGSILASASVQGESSSSNTGQGSVSSSTTIAEAVGVGVGAEATTGGETTGTGDRGVFRFRISVRTVSPLGKASVTVAHTTAVGS